MRPLILIYTLQKYWFWSAGLKGLNQKIKDFFEDVESSNF